ncbi:PAS domain S-box-containing protein/diguanylate cyclase (GGDEF) domain-containing protein [Thiohalomonas denitrificans]|uniref:cyclic-guanylate-specific phosphodiesterase n=2 Tax=Thiohalomonas denitrificans TaxID=415747 RepID=A0A1G5QKR4_9GAMM|nr:PAS domain S-box-containing protein/diguanylate cyclase (GGDEF) domain-containing protein [Thiohalomonas denitrificans]
MTVFDAVADAVFVHDRNYRVVYANPAYCKRSRLDAEACLGRPYWEVFPLREGPLPGCRQAIEQGGVEASEDEFTDSAGNVFLSRGYPVHCGEGSYAVHILVDVTAARREQSRLRQLRQALHEGREAFITIDAMYRINYVNPAFEALLGYRADELRGRTLELLSPEGAADEIQALLESPTNWEGETLRRHKDGTLIPVYLCLSAVRDEDGNQDGWVASLRDLRGEKAAQAELARQAGEMAERLKELNCLYAVANLTAPGDLPLEDLFGEIVSRLRAAHQYPDITEARIRFEGRDYASTGFVETSWLRRAPLRLDGATVGDIEVVYREARPPADHGPFLREEKRLLEAVADQLSAALADRRSRAALAEREAFYHSILEDMPGMVCRWRADGTITYVSESFCRYSGKTRDELVGRSFLPLIPAEDREELAQRLRSLTPDNPTMNVENRVFDAKGAIRWQRWTNRALFDAEGRLLEYQGVGEDITDEREAAEQVESFARFPKENPYPIARVAADGTLLLANPATDPLLEAAGVRGGAPVPPEWQAAVREALVRGQPQRFEQTSGEVCFLFVVTPIAEAGYANLYGTDVTELRRQEERLQRRVALETTLASASRDFVENPGEALDGAIERTLAAVGELAGGDRSYLFLFERDGERMSNTHEWCNAGITPLRENFQHLPTAPFEWSLGELRAHGRFHIGDVAGLPDGPERDTLRAQDVQSLALVSVMAGGEMVGFIGFDAVRRKTTWHTEDLRLLQLVADLVSSALARRGMEASLQRANRALRTLSACNEALIHAEDEQGLLRRVCEQVVEVGGYRMAWIGYAENDEQKNVPPRAHAGFEAGYLDTVKVTWSDEPSGRGPAGRAIVTGEPKVVRFAGSDPRFAPWRVEALKRGYRSVAGLPLSGGGENFGALLIYAGEPDAFDEAEMELLRDLAGDLAFGIVSLRARAEREQAAADLVRGEERLLRLVDTNPNAVLVVDREGGVRFANPAAEALFDRRLVDNAFGLPLAAEERTEVYVTRPGKPAVVAEMHAVELEWLGDPCWLVTLYDVTELRHQEVRLLRLNRTQSVLSECNQALVRAASEQELLEAFCGRLADIGGYRLAWVGYRQEDADRSVEPIARAGAAQAYLEGLRVGWGDDERGSGPTGVAIRTGEPAICRDSLDEPGFRPWREAAREHNLRSAIALPLRIDGEVIGALQIYADLPDAFDTEEQSLLAELADDLAFGIHGQRTRRAREQAEAVLQVRNRAVESAHDGIMVTAVDRGVVYVNPAFTQITGYSQEEMIGRDPGLLAGDDRDQPGIHALNSALKRGKEAAVLLRNYRSDGSLFWNELHVSPVVDADGTVGHYVGIINDVTDRKRYEEQLEYQANFDLLTGLPNRNLMQDRLAQALAHARRHDCLAALLFLDIDRFKLVNDTLGHDRGDELLQGVAKRLEAVLHSSDTVARYGGDEFVVILPDIGRPEDVAQVAERLLHVLSEPILMEGHEFQATASIGASLYPRDGRDGGTLLKNADSAMYQAKEMGRNNFQFFTAELNSRLLQRMGLESGLRRAIEREELTLHYQPQLDLHTGAVVGVEALLRWHHPELGMVSPADFIPLAEETGLIIPIGEWVLRSACRQAVQWRQAGMPPLTVAVNISARQMVRGDLVETVTAIIEETGLEPAVLEIELTESAMMERPEEMAAMLQRLKGIGVQLALDDFGTGFSSLSYLHRFPFDKVKIDKAFVHDITVNPHNAAIVLSILSLAKGLGLTVIAEGVENEAQLRYLRYRGCSQMQGFLYSRPLPPGEAADLVREGGLDLAALDEEELPTLLAVDDEPDITRALRRLLRRQGYRVLTATTPEEAFELMAMHRVQVLLCDQGMPEMKGTELLSRVKRLYPHTIRMILSDYIELNVITEAVNRGWVYKFLTKPWNDEELKAEIRGAFVEYEHNRMAADT